MSQGPDVVSGVTCMSRALSIRASLSVCGADDCDGPAAKHGALLGSSELVQDHQELPSVQPPRSCENLKPQNVPGVSANMEQIPAVFTRGSASCH